MADCPKGQHRHLLADGKTLSQCHSISEGHSNEVTQQYHDQSIGTVSSQTRSDIYGGENGNAYLREYNNNVSQISPKPRVRNKRGTATHAVQSSRLMETFKNKRLKGAGKSSALLPNPLYYGTYLAMLYLAKGYDYNQSRKEDAEYRDAIKGYRAGWDKVNEVIVNTVQSDKTPIDAMNEVYKVYSDAMNDPTFKENVKNPKSHEYWEAKVYADFIRKTQEYTTRQKMLNDKKARLSQNKSKSDTDVIRDKINHIKSQTF